LLVKDDESERASWAPVEDDTCNIQAGVVVPIPTKVLLPPFTYIALGKAVDVVVANLELPPPPPPVASVPQIMFPALSVSNASLQLTIVEMAKP
jgi:hypothetical protein